MAGRVEGKVVVVTGAASGLGLADARALVAEGAQVVMTDVNAESGGRLAEELGATFFTQDVSDEAGWDQLMVAVKDTFGRQDGLVNNAGIAIAQDIEHATTEAWRRILAIHLDGTFFGCRAAFPLLKASGGGSIVNMSSTAALVGIAPYLAYSAAKGGIRSMTKSIAVHAKQQKLLIRCNSVHPGSINTPMVQDAMRTLMNVDIADGDPEETRHRLGIGDPADVAHMVVYLISDESKHVNGAEMVIDNADTVI